MATLSAPTPVIIPAAMEVPPCGKSKKGKKAVRTDSAGPLLVACGICLSDVASTDFTSLCGNPEHAFCRSCQAGYLSSHIREGSIEAIRCTHPACEVKSIHLNRIKEVAPQDMFHRFERLQLERALDGMEDVMWCPSKGCGLPVVVSLRRNHGKCACGFCFCIRCKQASHYGNCPPEDKGDTIQLMSQWLLAHTKQCPQCFVFIEKNGGCDHHYCTRCQFHFNWSQARAGTALPLVVDKGKVLEERVNLTFVPEVRKKEVIIKAPSRRCVNCRQAMYKFTQENLIACTNCKHKSCFCCGLLSPPGSHFKAPNTCRQHTPLPAPKTP